jgi:hypothetical protein
MRYGDYLNHRWFQSLLYGEKSLYLPPLGMLITKLVRDNRRAGTIMMFEIADCADKCLGRPWRVPVTGSNKLDMFLMTYIHCVLHRHLMAVHQGMNVLTSNCMLRLIHAASRLKNDFSMCIIRHIVGGCIGNFAVD